MTEVLLPESSVPETRDAKVVGKDELVLRLDALLERYLWTLDEYQKLTEQLGKSFSTGFFSLAQANFQNRSSSTRYGQDCYDERMQAVRKIVVSTDDQDDITQSQIGFSTTSSLKKALEKTTPASPTREKEEKPSEADVPDTEPPSEPLNSNSASDDKPKDEKPAEETNAPKDPIRMFGILVPQALRDAQASFATAVDGSIPRLATVARDLRIQEIEIGRVRKAIKKL